MFGFFRKAMDWATYTSRRVPTTLDIARRSTQPGPAVKAWSGFDPAIGPADFNLKIRGAKVGNAAMFAGKAANRYGQYVFGNRSQYVSPHIYDTMRGRGRYVHGFLGGMKRGFEATGMGAGARALGISPGGTAFANAGQAVGQGVGMISGAGYKGAKTAVGAAAGAAMGAWKYKTPITAILGFGTAIGAFASSQGGGLGSPADLYTYGTGRDTRGTRIGSQLEAIYEDSIYRSSSMAGMGAPMRFGRSGIETPIPMFGWAQKAGGYSPEALGATGDLVFALGNLRRQ